MGRLFGTDGVRGEAGITLTPKMAFKLGQSAGQVLLNNRLQEGNSVVIGRDGRISGQMLEASLAAGLTSVGINVILLGVIPTPGVAWLVRNFKALAGVVISASHNPYWDNGIKFFDQNGCKLSDEVENMIEELYFNEEKINLANHENIGQIRSEEMAIEQYRLFLESLAEYNNYKYNIVIDCANGAASNIAERLFSNLGNHCKMLSDTPNGININLNCGSTHMNNLIQTVQSSKADIGFAFDGDADRFLAVDADGNIIDGDFLLAIYAKYFKDENRLKNNLLVLTVMSNLGLKIAMKEQGVSLHETKVGDRYVNEGMMACDAIIGGEQSGHIIFKEYNTTGDGLLSAIILLNIMKKRNQTLKELATVMRALPQVLINVPVTHKDNWEESREIRQAIQIASNELGNTGRVLVRASGTEDLLRVMVEGPNKYVTEKIAEKIAVVIRNDRGRI